MSTVDLSKYDKESVPSASEMTFGIIVSDWNSEVTYKLLEGARETLLLHGADSENICEFSFTGKRIVATPTLVNKGIVTLTGIFSPQALVANDKTTLFVGTPDGAGNNLFYPSTNGNLKGMRAYFKVDSGSGSPVRRARFVVDAETMATEIGNTEIQARTEKQLIDGQLFIIRDGVRYNTIGQIIK